MYRSRNAGVAHARRDDKIDWMQEQSKARQNSYQMSESASSVDRFDFQRPS
jgi:hypothetical protein